ncbi:MAG: hypothetical protein AAGF92_08235 [Myxococcota bacterium]
MKYSWIAITILTLALLPTSMVSAQRPGTEDPGGGIGDSTEQEFREDNKMESDESTVEAFEDDFDSTVETEVDARPATEGPASKPPTAGTQRFEESRTYNPDSIRVTDRSSRNREPDEKIIPLKFQFHGYYRARYNWIGENPLPRNPALGGNGMDYPTANASYGYMRLRLDPEVTYGPNPDLPIARLRFTIDGFDNVVFGDNARVFNVPLFATDQSLTNVDGFDLRESLRLERAWIEFLVPVGQIRVGRMESQWGVGLLTHAGNGLADWGDFFRGETFDRILFATRPLTVGRAIKNGDSRQTPLIYAFVYDRLSQNQVADPIVPRPPPDSIPDPFTYRFLPYTTYFADPNATGGNVNGARPLFPNQYLTTLGTRVNEIVNVLAWFDEDYGRAENDELFAGVYFVYRWQSLTQSKIFIPDVSWRLQHTLAGKRRLAITTEGEYVWIGGRSGALAFTGENTDNDPPTCSPSNNVSPCRRGMGNIHNVLARIGLKSEGNWSVQLEGGFSSGDDDLLSFTERGEGQTPTLRARGFNQNIKVGLLMYQVALKALTFDRLFTLGPALELGANGSVWNSKYLMPSYRVTIVNGLEFHTQFLVGWAAALDPLIYRNAEPVSNCGFKGECFMGWELDGAIRARMGADDIVWIDIEAGVFQPGGAFTNAGFRDIVQWTVQMRAAMVF